MALPGWCAVILAAGAGRRFGGGKLLAPLDGVPMIRRTAQAVTAGGFDEVLVIIGEHVRLIGDALAGLDCHLVEATDWQQGISASIRAGVAGLPDEGEGAFLFLGDMPLVPVALCSELARLAQHSGYAARPRVDGKPGHPVCFVRSALPDLMQLSGDRGAGDALKDRALAYLDTDDSGALLDIDDAASLALAERAWNSRATSATTDSAISRGALPKP
jgi:molybdenum cofactor cytidylyltransferase